MAKTSSKKAARFSVKDDETAHKFNALMQEYRDSVMFGDMGARFPKKKAGKP